MTVIQFLKRLLVVLNLSASFKKRGEEVQAIITACLECDLVTWPDHLLGEAQEMLDAFVKAQANMLFRTTGNKAIRNAAWEKLFLLIIRIKNVVQDTADANPAQAEAIITGCKFKVKRSSSRQKQTDQVKNGVTEGTILLFGQVLPHTKAHEWSMSTDGEIWIMLPFTLFASTLVTGQIAGTKLYFRHRVITKFGVEKWGVTMVIIVI